MHQPPKDKKQEKLEKIIGETAPDKTGDENDNKAIVDKVAEEIKTSSDMAAANLNIDQKITNDDEKNDKDDFAY